MGITQSAMQSPRRSLWAALLIAVIAVSICSAEDSIDAEEHLRGGRTAAEVTASAKARIASFAEHKQKMQKRFDYQKAKWSTMTADQQLASKNKAMGIKPGSTKDPNMENLKQRLAKVEAAASGLANKAHKVDKAAKKSEKRIVKVETHLSVNSAKKKISKKKRTRSRKRMKKRGRRSGRRRKYRIGRGRRSRRKKRLSKKKKVTKKNVVKKKKTPS